MMPTNCSILGTLSVVAGCRTGHLLVQAPAVKYPAGAPSRARILVVPWCSRLGIHQTGPQKRCQSCRRTAGSASLSR